MLNKLIFYSELKLFKNKNIDINLNIKINDNYEIYFSWWRIAIKNKKEYKFEYKKEMVLTIIDRKKQGFRKYIKELHFNYENESIDTDYKLFKFCKNKINEEILKYERGNNNG